MYFFHSNYRYFDYSFHCDKFLNSKGNLIKKPLFKDKKSIRGDRLKPLLKNFAL